VDRSQWCQHWDRLDHQNSNTLKEELLMITSNRIGLATVALLAVLAFLCGAVAAIVTTETTTVSRFEHGLSETVPAGAVGSGIHLPLGGER